MRTFLLVAFLLTASPLFAQENLLESIFGIRIGSSPAPARAVMLGKHGVVRELDSACGEDGWTEVYHGGSFDGCDLAACGVGSWVLLFSHNHLSFVQITIDAGNTDGGALVARYRALREVLVGRFGHEQNTFGPQNVEGWFPGIGDADLYVRMVSSDTWLSGIWLIRSDDAARALMVRMEHDRILMIYRDATDAVRMEREEKH